jgi:hypothetical protein
VLTAACGGPAGLRSAIAKCVIGNAAAVHPIPDEWAAYRVANDMTIAFTGANERVGMRANIVWARPTRLYTAIASARPLSRGPGPDSGPWWQRGA